MTPLHHPSGMRSCSINKVTLLIGKFSATPASCTRTICTTAIKPYSSAGATPREAFHNRFEFDGDLEAFVGVDFFHRDARLPATTFKGSKRRNRDVETRMNRQIPLNHRDQYEVSMSRSGYAHWHSDTVGKRRGYYAQTDGASLQKCRRSSTRSHKVACCFLLIRCTVVDPQNSRIPLRIKSQCTPARRAYLNEPISATLGHLLHLVFRN